MLATSALQFLKLEKCISPSLLDPSFDLYRDVT